MIKLRILLQTMGGTLITVVPNIEVSYLTLYHRKQIQKYRANIVHKITDE